jgi:hypothetical protein
MLDDIEQPDLPWVHSTTQPHKEGKMEWQIAVDEPRGLIIITAKGRLKVTQAAEMATQAIALARDHVYHRCLIDYRMVEMETTTLEMYIFVKSLGKLGITYDDRVAIVYAIDEAKHHFAETVALNRGWANIQYFSEMESAINWLCSSSNENDRQG